MLKNTFCHIPGIGLVTERRLWDAGLHSWGDLSRLDNGSLPLSKSRAYGLKTYLDQSMKHLQDGNPRYFAELLPSGQAWRLFGDFHRSVAYIDIETTGMGSPSDYITTIALYDGSSVFWYVHGQNLEDFVAQIRRYDLIVTFNGKSFDLPFIRNYLGIPMSQAHVDLRHVLKGLGYTGGLKSCEKQLGIDREDLDGVDGYFAVLLWNEYKKKGSTKALETLLAYNIQDVVNLESLMILSYNLKLKGTPFHDLLALDVPSPPTLPFKADIPTIEGIKSRLAPIAPNWW